MKRMQRLVFPALALCCLLLMGGWLLGRRSAPGVTLRSRSGPPAGTQAVDRSLPAADPAPEAPQTRLDLNSATLEELMGLPGIGQARAERILAYRSAHGGFRSASELMLVDGVGEAVYAGLRDLIYVEERDENTDY